MSTYIIHISIETINSAEYNSLAAAMKQENFLINRPGAGQSAEFSYYGNRNRFEIEKAISNAVAATGKLLLFTVQHDTSTGTHAGNERSGLYHSSFYNLSYFSNTIFS